MADAVSAAELPLRQALGSLTKRVLDGEEQLPADVHDEVVRFCHVAREAGLPPEQVLKRLKAIVAETHPTQTLSENARMAGTVWSLVSGCVASYFRRA